jgi:hypothetical protein
MLRCAQHDVCEVPSREIFILCGKAKVMNHFVVNPIVSDLVAAFAR